MSTRVNPKTTERISKMQTVIALRINITYDNSIGYSLESTKYLIVLIADDHIDTHRNIDASNYAINKFLPQ